MASLLGHLSRIPILHHLVILLILFQIPPYSSSNDEYKNCTNLISCGNIRNIGFPFWGENRPKECGHPLMQLRCQNEISYINIKNVSYKILEANTDKRILRITRVDYLASLCPTEHVNTNLDTDLFVYGLDYKNITLSYGCGSSNSWPSPINKFPCYALSDYVYPHFGPDPGFCKESVFVPVPSSFFDISDSNEVQKAIVSGFVVRWIVGVEECDKCKTLGGVCGIDWLKNNQTTCYCQYEPCPNFSPDEKAKTPSPGKSKTGRVAIGAGVGGVVLLILILGCVFFVMKRRRKVAYNKSRSGDLFMAPSSGDTFTSTTNTSQTQSVSSYQSSKSNTIPPRSYYFGVQVFTYEELEEATRNFDTSRELGEGGFGTVYKGDLKDGRVVAVKRLYESNFKRMEQFMNEVEILARIRHKNLVTLYGCTSRHSRELLLVYEFIPNGTVADHLQGNRSKSNLLPWPIRLNIAVETAEALAYLHSRDVIHRDVKTNNILLDDKFCVKVADFGLSRLFPNDVTHVSTAPQGTPGYVDPEYYQCYQLTDKSDVYSFGVVLVELISSLQAVDVNRQRNDVNLANMAVNKIQNQELHEFVDPSLGFERDHAIRRMTTAVAELAFRCLQQERDMRPSMDEVVDVLRGIKSGDLGGEGKESEILEIRTDEVRLLKKVPASVSPDSVVDKWVSGSSVSNNSL